MGNPAYVFRPGCELFVVPDAIGIAWCTGYLTDYAMVRLSQPTGPCLFIKQITGKLSWRHLAHELQIGRYGMFAFRAMSPLVKKRAEQFGAEHTHTDEFGPRYLVRGDVLQKFVEHFPSSAKVTYKPRFAPEFV